MTMTKFPWGWIIIFALALGLALGMQLETFAQSGDNTFPPSGNVGIGIPNPRVNLDVVGTNPVLQLEDSATHVKTFMQPIGGVGYIGTASDNDLGFWVGTREGLRVTSQGNVGIGTSKPAVKLQIQGKPGFAPTVRLESAANDDSTIELSSPDYQWALTNRNSMDDSFQIWDGISHKERLVINTNGNVGIGTTHPAEKLSVNGTVLSKETIVSTAASRWPDFVLQRDYGLMPLDELEQFIEENGHLPGIPTAEEVGDDGVALGEMNAKLLQKLEEQTLYTLQLKKEIETLEARTAALEK